MGSSNYITNFVGEVSQHSEYFAFGETFIEEHKNSHNSPFKFNGKELDEETGFYYYGARYYDPKISIWLSVDPLAEKYPDWNPYNYCMQNPINMIDPDGRESMDWGRKGNQWYYSKSITKANYKQLGYSDYSNGRTNNTYKTTGGATVTLNSNGSWTQSSSNYSTSEFTKSKFEASGHVYNAQVTSNTEYHKFNGDFNFLTGNIYAKSDFTGLDVGFNGSIIKTGFNQQIGHDYLNVHQSLQGYVGHAEANFTGGVFLNRNELTGYSATANAGVYGLKVDYTLGGSIGPFSYDASVTATAYSAHIGGGSSYLYNSKTNTFSFSVKQHFGLGFGEGTSSTFSIDFNKVKNIFKSVF